MILYDIYYERQRGGLCKLHSINAYFGKHEIKDEEFVKYKKEYVDEYKKKFNTIPSTDSDDCINSDQTTVISYILKKYNIYTKFYGLNSLFKKDIKKNILDILEGEFFFIYNINHIYGIRKKNNVWYSVDSIAGVKIININTLKNTKNVGFIVPVNKKDELYRNLYKLKKEINIDTINLENRLQKIKDYIIKLDSENKILGEIEVPLSVIIDIMQTNLDYKNSKSQKCTLEMYDPIKNLVDRYNEFLPKFSNNNYKNIKLKLEYLPDIISILLTLGNFSPVMK